MRRYVCTAFSALLAAILCVVFSPGTAHADASGQTVFRGGLLRIDVTGRGDQIYMVKGSFKSLGTGDWHFTVNLWNVSGSNYETIPGPVHYSNNRSGSFTWAPNSYPAWGGKACVSLFSNQDRVATACVGIFPANVFLRSSFNGHCLDADLNTIGRNGTKVQLWKCNNQPQQGWVLDQNGAIRSIRDPGRCLDADLNTIGGNGAKVQLWDCNNQRQQVWIVTPTGAIRSALNGRCLDADLNTIGGNGAKVQLWDCNNQRQQNWY
ncbi:RICIN domain-containing protein [Streptomyces sp. NPDC001288]|uniref:RICIN domain-containing protein n=1 Tax=unclassified Streptomyces TaxID=2593676 RepID=UPI003326DE47